MTQKCPRIDITATLAAYIRSTLFHLYYFCSICIVVQMAVIQKSDICLESCSFDSNSCGAWRDDRARRNGHAGTERSETCRSTSDSSLKKSLKNTFWNRSTHSATILGTTYLRARFPRNIPLDSIASEVYQNGRTGPPLRSRASLRRGSRSVHRL